MEKPKVCCVYKNDYNILKIDEIIRGWFQTFPKILEDLKVKLNVEYGKLRTPVTGGEYKDIKTKITEIKTIIDDISSGSLIQNYEEKTKKLLDDYRKMGILISRVTFGNEDSREITMMDSERISIIERYLYIAGKYIDVQVSRSGIDIVVCPNCDKEIKGDEGETMKCLDCGIVMVNVIKPIVTENVAVAKNNYRDRDNFIKSLQRYEGKESIKLGEELFNALDEYFRGLSLPTGKEVRAMNLDEQTKRNIITKKMLYRALRSSGYTSYYENSNLICSMYLGWKLPDISVHYQQLLKDYDDSQVIYEQLKAEGFVAGTSSINTQIRTLAHLKHIGHECDISDFKVSENIETLTDYDRTLGEMWRRLGWQYTKIV
jgi:hypothetical protein